MHTPATPAGPIVPKGRRTFLAATAAAGALAAPAVSRAQTTTLRMQGVWGPKDPLNTLARIYADTVNAMAGSRLRIDYLNVGTVVPPFGVLDAVSQGKLDAGHHSPTYWSGKHPAGSLFGTGPAFGFNSDQFLGWVHQGGGQQLYDELMRDVLKANVVGFFSYAWPTQPLGWFKKPITSPADFKGMKYRAVGLSGQLFAQMGAELKDTLPPAIVGAMKSGELDGFEFNNPASDRLFGFGDVAKHYVLSSYHQLSESFEVVFNKGVFEGLASEQQALLRGAAKSAAAEAGWLAQDLYSKGLQQLVADGVTVQRTPASVLDAQLDAWARLTRQLEADPFSKRVLDSQRAWARRVGFWALTNEADHRRAYERVFGPLPT